MFLQLNITQDEAAVKPSAFFVAWERNAELNELNQEHGYWLDYQTHVHIDGVAKFAPDGKCKCGSTYDVIGEVMP
jgi:hypothetical protein